MENQFFSHTPQLHFDPSIPNWQSEQTQDCFYTPTWENKSTTDHTNNLQFDSALSSMVSSPAASNSNISNDNFVIRELIGKLGNITSSDEIYNNNNNNNSCYTTPLSSPPKLMKSMALNSTVAEFSADPAFAERAAKFSCFGSRSFNGGNVELTQRSISLIENGKLSRVSSSPSLKALGVGAQNHCSSSSQLMEQMEIANSQEESTISEQAPNGDNGVKSSRKRKASSKGKAKENPPVVSENCSRFSIFIESRYLILWKIVVADTVSIAVADT